MVDAAVVAARLSGMSEAGIGLTIVAVGTSLPELVTSVLASAHGQGDVAIGNVIGSNVFNVFSILGITGAAHPLSQGGVASVDIVVMIGLSALLVPLLLTGRRLTRIEGIALLLAYVVYVGWRVVGAGAAV